MSAHEPIFAVFARCMLAYTLGSAVATQVPYDPLRNMLRNQSMCDYINF